MNFLVNKLTFHRIPAPAWTSPSQVRMNAIRKATFVFIGTFFILEVLVLWQMFRPADIILTEPTSAPRPESDRVGILRRF